MNEINIEALGAEPTQEEKINQKLDQDKLLSSYFALENSDDPKDRELFEKVKATFQEKMARFDDQLSDMSRKVRRSIKGRVSYSQQFKKGIGL